MCANPHPAKLVAGDEDARCPIVKPHPDRPELPLKRLEIQRGMVWVSKPEPVVIFGQPLRFCWQPVEALPEFWRGCRSHSRGRGKSRAFCSRSQRSASSIIQSSLPASASARICLSHSSSGRGCSRALSSQRSRNESLSIAALISSTFVTPNTISAPLPAVNPATAQARHRDRTAEPSCLANSRPITLSFVHSATPA